MASILLVAGMLVSGVCNTILNKFQDMQCVENCDDTDDSKHKYFEQPVWQTLNMFVGETLCFVAVYVVLAWERYKRKNTVSGAYASIGTEHDLTDDPGVVSTAENDISSSSPIDDLKGWRVYVFWLPTMCDIIGTTLMNVGLIYTSASVYQMLRGAVVLFTAGLSMLFLKHPISPSHWFSLFLVVLGVTIVGMSSVLFPPADTAQTKPEASEAIAALIGVSMVLVAQIFTASQFVLEEKIMHRYRVKPLRAVGLEGIFGLGTVILGMIVLHFTTGVTHPDGYFNITTGFHQIFDNPGVLKASIAICFSIAFFNYFGLSVTRTISATSRTTIDTTRIVFVWVVSLFYGWETFSWLQVIGFVILVLGTSMFNDVISPPPCFAGSVEIEDGPLLPEDHEHM